MHQMTWRAGLLLWVAMALTGCSEKKTELGQVGLVQNYMDGGAGIGWSNTNEGKVIAAAFWDAHNQLVVQAQALQAKQLPPAVPIGATGAGAPG